MFYRAKSIECVRSSHQHYPLSSSKQSNAPLFLPAGRLAVICHARVLFGPRTFGYHDGLGIFPRFGASIDKTVHSRNTEREGQASRSRHSSSTAWLEYCDRSPEVLSHCWHCLVLRQPRVCTFFPFFRGVSPEMPPYGFTLIRQPLHPHRTNANAPGCHAKSTFKHLSIVKVGSQSEGQGISAANVTRFPDEPHDGPRDLDAR